MTRNDKKRVSDKKMQGFQGQRTSRNKERQVPSFRPKQLPAPFSSHSPPSMPHVPMPSLDDKDSRLQAEEYMEMCCDSGNDANHLDE